MASNLLKTGYNLNIYNRSKHKANDLVFQGANWCDTPTEVALKSHVIITMVGYPQDVEQIYFSPDGLLANAYQGSILIDMTTSTPTLAKKIASAAVGKNIYAIDAPVSGGDVGAKNASLSIMVGGEIEIFKEVKELLSAMGSNITYQGEAGSGQYTKMVNQIIVAGTMLGISEGMAYAKFSSLDQKKVLTAIESGAAGSFSLNNLAPRMISGDFRPGFYIKHFLKDLSIAIQSAEELNLKLPGISLVKILYEQLAELGEGDSGTQALYKLFCD